MRDRTKARTCSLSLSLDHFCVEYSYHSIRRLWPFGENKHYGMCIHKYQPYALDARRSYLNAYTAPMQLTTIKIMDTITAIARLALDAFLLVG